ncbi:hypothetical protein FM112_03875 [Gulosibacter sp. 10]|nr:hypothetical protein FM112_03875 [Gulosibacter sp. 10]
MSGFSEAITAPDPKNSATRSSNRRSAHEYRPGARRADRSSIPATRLRDRG